MELFCVSLLKELDLFFFLCVHLLDLFLQDDDLAR